MHRFYERKAEAVLQRRSRNKYPVFRDYVLLGEIGRGSFGEVHFAVRIPGLQPYAVKIIHKKKAREKSSSLRVRKEIKIMQQLNHPNVVHLIDVTSTRSRVLLTMDLVTNGELFDEVDHFGRLSEPYARFFFQQLVRGLDYCHSNGVYHRDLKPDNLLIDRNKTLKITDFGLSTLFDSRCGQTNETAMLHTPVGTPNYVAPELISMSSEGYNGAKADAWSCGVILFVMCGGYMPFDSNNVFQTFRQIKRCAVEYPPHFSENLKDLLSNIFQFNPRVRYSLRDMARHPWFFGPVTTSEVGDERPLTPNKLDLMMPRIQEVIQSYDSYLEAVNSRNFGVNVPVKVNPSTSVDRPILSGSPARRGNPNDSALTRDSLALGWLGASMDIDLDPMQSVTGEGPARIDASRAGPTAGASSASRAEPVPNPASGVELNPNSSNHSHSQLITHTSHDPMTSFNQSASQVVSESEALRITDPPSTGAENAKNGHRAPNGILNSEHYSIEASNGVNGLKSALSRGTAISSPRHSGSEPDSDYEDAQAAADRNSAKLTDLTHENPNNQHMLSLPSSAIGGDRQSSGSDSPDDVRKFGETTKFRKMRGQLWNSIAETLGVGPTASTEESTDERELLASNNSASNGISKAKFYRGRTSLKSSRKRSRLKGRYEDKNRFSELRNSFESNMTLYRSVDERRTSFASPPPLSDKSSFHVPSDHSDYEETRDHVAAMWDDLPNNVWCKLMRDVDMIPDKEEFDIDSRALQEHWSLALEQDGIRSRPVVKKSISRSERMLSSKKSDSRSTLPNASIETAQVRISSARPEDRYVMKPSLTKLEEDIIIEGDLLTLRQIPDEWMRKFVGKTDFRWRSEEVVVQNDNRGNQRRQRREEYYKYFNAIMSATGEQYEVVTGPNEQVQENPANNEEFSSGNGVVRPNSPMSTRREMTVTIQSSLSMCLASRQTETGAGSLTSAIRMSEDVCDMLMVGNTRDVANKQSLTQVAIGPLHDEYRRNETEENDDNREKKNVDLEEEKRRKTRLELLEQVKFFDFDIEGPGTELRLERSVPFQRFFTLTRSVLKRMSPLQKQSAELRASNGIVLRSHLNVTDFERMLRNIIPGDGVTIGETRNLGERVKVQIDVARNGVKFVMNLRIYKRTDDAILKSEAIIKWTSGNLNEYFRFIEAFEDKYNDTICSRSTALEKAT